MKNERKTELLVGMFMLVGLLMMASLIMRFGKVRDYFRGSYVKVVQFRDATGLRAGVPVLLGGHRVGKVKSDPVLNSKTYTEVTVELEVYEQYKIPDNSRYEIATSGLMGDSYIAIRPAAAPPKKLTAEDGAEILVGEEPKGLSNLAQTAEDIGKKTGEVLDDVKNASSLLKDALQRIKEGALNDDTLKSFHESMARLESAMKSVDNELLGKANREKVTETLAALKDAATSFKSASATIDETTKKLGPVIDRIEPTMAKVDKAVTSADAAMQGFKQTGENLSIFTKDMAKGEGLMKALLLDKELRDDFKALIANLKNHGVLFYRDDSEKAATEQKIKDTQDQQRRAPSPLRPPGR